MQAAFSGTFGVVGDRAVLIEQEQHLVRGLLQLAGPDFDREADEAGLDPLAGRCIDKGR